MTKAVGADSRRAEIQLIVAQVENLKQIHLSDEEAAALVNALDRTGKPVEEIRQMGINVARSPDYGRIPLDMWLNAARLYTLEEVGEEVKRRIRDRQWLAEHLHVDEEEARRIADLDVRREYYVKLEAVMEDERRKVKQVAHIARAWYVLQPEPLQLAIFDYAVKRGWIADDPALRRHRTTAYVCLEILPAIEDYMNRMSPGEEDSGPATD